MTDIKALFFVTMYNIFISIASSSLGLTSNTLESATMPELIEDIGVLEALWGVVTIIFNGIGSFIQLATLQTDLPDVLSVILVYPSSFVMIFIILRLIRG